MWRNLTMLLEILPGSWRETLDWKCPSFPVLEPPEGWGQD